MIKRHTTNISAAVMASLMSMAGSPLALAEQAWHTDSPVGGSGDWKRTALAQADTYHNASSSSLDFDLKTDRELPVLLADASGEAEGGEEPKSAHCAELEKDRDADIGAMIRAGCQPTTAQMSRLMDNPLGNVAMLFTQFDLTKMTNPSNDKEANKFNYMGIAQFPKGLGENWNLINRIVWNVPSMPIDQDKIDQSFGNIPGGILPPSGSPQPPLDLFSGRTTGFGDMYYVGLFSPKEAKTLEGGAKALWGAGFDLGFPTATEDVLGTGKWTGGPSALGVYMGPKWKFGALAQHYWDFAGDSDRDPVNLTNLQYFYMYSLDPVTSIGAAPNIIINWEQDGGIVRYV